MKTPKAPAAPDPIATASAQTGTNLSTAIANAKLNQVNQITPDGSLNWSQSGSSSYTDPTTGQSYDLPQFTATQTLSPAQQAIKTQSDAADLNMATLANKQTAFLGDYLGKGINVSSLPKGGDLSGLQTSLDTDFTASRQRVEDALMTRLNPQLQQDRAALETQMSNQGIKLGSTAYDRGIDTATRQSNDARLGAILSAGQEESRLFGQSLSAAGFSNSVKAQQAAGADAQRAAALQEMFAVRNQPINEIAALQAGSAVATPNFMNTGTTQIPTVDYAGLAQSNYQAQNATYNQQLASRGQMMGGILGVAGQYASTL